MKDMKTTKPFNMIEITLALGIIAIGVVAVLGLFPIGAAAGRDAIAETYAAETANQLMSWLEFKFRDTGTDWATFRDTLPSSEPTEADFDATAQTGTGGTIFRGTTSGSANGTYKVIRYVDVGGTAEEYDAGTDILDFDSAVRVWRSSVSIDTASGTVAVGSDYAVQLNIEVSWPYQLDYADRNIAEYNLELFNR